MRHRAWRGEGCCPATQSWQGALVSVLATVVAAAIWFPFIRSYDLKLAKKEAEGATEA